MYHGIHGIKIFFGIPTGCCRFSPSCSEYAKEAIEKLPVFKAILAIAARVLRCHPMNCGGFDPVPDNKATSKG